MQTFLPFPDFHKSAACLDMKRLGKQRVETLQILQTLTRGSRWRNHPAVKMWEGYIPALVEYGIAVCEEWLARGYKDTCLDKIKAFRFSRGVYPHWFGDEDFHKAHRQILLGKNYEWYSKFGWGDRPAEMINGKWPYLWP